jgi:hypothetical protein
MEKGNVTALAFLPHSQLIEVRMLPNNQRRGMIVAAFIDLVLDEMVVYNGNEEEFIVPLSFFEPSGDGTAPDFKAIEIIDYGHTVKLGEYEAASRAILYDIDPQYKLYVDANRMTN